jgi:hypothetical protein
MRVGSPPGTRSSAAASVKSATQPKTGRSGMYSPNGTSRILSYHAAGPAAVIRTADLEIRPFGRRASTLTSTSVPAAAAAATSRSRTHGSCSGSNPTLLWPHTMRSGSSSTASRVSSSLAARRTCGPWTTPGWTPATRR